MATPDLRIVRLDEDAWERLRRVRLAALEEAPEAFGTTLAQGVAWPPSTWQEQLRGMETFVAVWGEADVGMVRALEHPVDPDRVYLISMWVDPVARGGGVGAALVDAVVGWTRERGRSEVVLDVREHNHHAIALYERCGFRATGERKFEPPPDHATCELHYRRTV